MQKQKAEKKESSKLKNKREKQLQQALQQKDGKLIQINVNEIKGRRFALFEVAICIANEWTTQVVGISGAEGVKANWPKPRRTDPHIHKHTNQQRRLKMAKSEKLKNPKTRNEEPSAQPKPKRQAKAKAETRIRIRLANICHRLCAENFYVPEPLKWAPKVCFMCRWRWWPWRWRWRWRWQQQSSITVSKLFRNLKTHFHSFYADSAWK